MPEYSLILLMLLVATIFLHRYFKLKIFNSKSHLIRMFLISLIVAIVWDQYAIFRGHWSFGQQFLLGPKIGYMPIEEFGFFFICTYFTLTLYKITEKRK